jgi:predicted RNase H-like HicB family nuclease
MRYSVFLEPVSEPEMKGYFYAHIPALDLTTHGLGPDGALKAAQELVEGWIAEKRSRGEKVPQETQSLVRHIDVPDALLSA